MIHLPVYRHTRRFLASMVVFGSIVLVMLWLPVQVVRHVFPNFLPFHVMLSRSVVVVIIDYWLIVIIIAAITTAHILRKVTILTLKPYLFIFSYSSVKNQYNIMIVDTLLPQTVWDHMIKIFYLLLYYLEKCKKLIASTFCEHPWTKLLLCSNNCLRIFH